MEGNLEKLTANQKDDSSFQLTFSDEFNAPEINKDRWTKVDGHRGWFRSKRDPKFKYSWFWKPQNVKVKEGEAILEFKHEFTNEKDTWCVIN